MGDTKNEKLSFGDKVKNWFKGLRSEFFKISWESREDITKETIAVVVISVVVGLLIALIDTILHYGINFLTGL